MRRFGRNQKRRMREQIANLGIAEKMSRELARHNGDELRSARAEIEDAKRIIGEHSALFSPQYYNANFRSRQYDVAMMLDISTLEGSMPIGNSYKRISLPVMLLEVQNRDKEEFSKLGDQIHMRLSFADNTIGYACSANALRYMGAYRIAQEIARLLHDKLQTIKP